MNESHWQLEEQFGSMFQFAPMGMILVNKQGIIIQVNLVAQNLYGYTKYEFNNLYFRDLIHPQYLNDDFDLIQEILVNQSRNFIAVQCFISKNGEEFLGKLFAHAVQDCHGNTQDIVVAIQSLSNFDNSQVYLPEAQTQLRRTITEQAEEIRQSQIRLQQKIAECKTVKKILKTQKELLQILINLYPNTILNTGNFALVTNANTLEAMESELQQTKEQLRAVLDAMPGFVCWVNSEGKYLGVNQYMADTFNVSPDIFVGKELSFLKNSPNFAQFMRKFLEETATTGHHVIEAKVNNCTRYYLIAAQKYHQNSLAVSVGIDITDRKLAEAQIQASLQEKEVLLQEIHHRVKNNLQVVSSLLDLQSQQIEDSDMLEVFRESQNRVKSMALVHEKLYQSKNFAKINFADYTESLVNYLLKAYDLNPDNVTLYLDIDEVAFNIDTAIPCGLIINELVSNALKYAFPNNRVGKITISLHSEANRHFTLIIKDDGVGLPMNWNFKKVKSLGLQLVKVLTKQLKGNLEIERNSGSLFRVNFSEIKTSDD